ncbi:MAG: hypothetical protein P8M11_01800 [Planctomycetota bacterium]|nr:hypothetical protein [Planctomycetota bacterium]MDG1983278.1 hypothetical protein [Planctomycetota bacterium]
MNLTLPLASLALATSATAQIPVFVGSSVGGSSDPWYLVDGDSGALLDQGNSSLSDNVTAALYSPISGRLLVSTSLPQRVVATEAGSVSPFSTTEFETGVGGSAYGLAFDSGRARLLTVASGSSGYALNIIDADPASGTYGTVTASGTIGGGERWAYSEAADVVVSAPIIFGGSVTLVDVDPSSATFLQPAPSFPTANIPFAFGAGATFSTDGRYAIPYLGGIDGTYMPCYDRLTSTWLDADPVVPGTQHFFFPYAVGSSIAPIPGVDAAIVTGLGSNNISQDGWFGRVDHSGTPDQWTFSLYGMATNDMDGASVDPSGARFAVTAYDPPRVIVGSTVTGSILTEAILPLTADNLYTTAWGGSVELGERFCNPAAVNSTGAAASLSALGSTAVASQDFTLIASQLPSSSFGFALVSQSRGFIPNPGGSQGDLCLGGSIGRFVGPGQIQQADSSGAWSLTVDLAQVPTPTGLVAVQPGDTWSFQAWYRDAVAGVTTSNFTSAIEVDFL